jgi:two-component system, NtrC family, sensor kinase
VERLRYASVLFVVSLLCARERRILRKSRLQLTAGIAREIKNPLNFVNNFSALSVELARAEKQTFNITLERSFDPAAGEVDLFPQDITRVLLNLEGGGYDPTLSAATKGLGDHVEIRNRDNGTGIPLEVRDKMFSPFFTAKPAGEGNGLGLSIRHDIIVKQHAGSIEVETEPGKFTEFKIILPRTAASMAKTEGRAS